MPDPGYGYREEHRQAQRERLDEDRRKAQWFEHEGAPGPTPTGPLGPPPTTEQVRAAARAKDDVTMARLERRGMGLSAAELWAIACIRRDRANGYAHYHGTG